MVLAAGAAGALIFGAAFSWGTTAMAVGWMVGGWLYSTLGKSNENGMSPQDMPQFNRALRGTPIFVTFGANRVWPQIPWAKNWTPHEQEGTGKGGGSGGGGKGAAAGGASYTYSWDLMYQFGFVDQPSFIRTAWNGSDVIAFETVSAWNANVVGVGDFFRALFNLRHGQKSDIATLEADEVFFAPGYATGDPNIETWSYFETQEGVRCQWPYTAWLGFKQLDLGPSGVTPQLSVELVPMGAATLDDSDAAYLANTTIIETTPNQSFMDYHSSNNMMALGEDGFHYTMGIGSNGNGFIMRVEDGTVVLNMTNAALAAMWDTFGASRDSTQITLGWGYGQGVVPNTPYLFIAGVATGTGGTRYIRHMMVMKVDATGTVVPFCYSVRQTSSLKYGLDGAAITASLGPNGAEFYYLCGTTLGLGTGTIAMKRYDLINFDDIAFGTENNSSTEYTGIADGVFGPGNSLRTDFSQACIVFSGTNVPSVICYMSQAKIDDPDGSLIILPMSEAGLIWSSGPNATDISDSLDTNFRSFVKTKLDGTASSSYLDDWCSPCSFEFGERYYLVWARPYNEDGTYITVRLALWNDDGSLTWLIHGVTMQAFSGGTYGTNPPVNFLANYCPESGKFYASGIYPGLGNNTQYAFADLGTVLLTAGQEDVTPPYMISRILTHPAFGVSVSALFGFSVTADSLDTDSYADSVAFCESEGIKVATTYSNQDNLLSTFDTLLALYGGMLVVVGGKIYFKVARDTDDTGRIVNNDHLLVAKAGTPPVTIHEPAIQDSYNQIQYNYIDRALDYKNNQIAIDNEVDMDINGPRPKAFPSRFVMAGSLAQMLAERALWSNLYGRRMYEFKLGWKDADLMPSDVITLVDSFDNGLRTGRKVRLVTKKEAKRGTFDTIAVDHISYHLTANHEFTSITSMYVTDNYITSVAPVNARMYELPKEFQNEAELYVGYNQLSMIMGAQLWLSNDGLTFNLNDQREPFIMSGVFEAALPVREPGYMEEEIYVYLMPTSPFDAATPTYCHTTALADIEEGARAAGQGVWIVGSEAIAVQGLTLVGQNHYRVRRMFRGWGGTPISAIDSGALWHWHKNTFEVAINQDDVGTILHYKVVPYNFGGTAYNISSIDARTYQIKGLYWLPRHQTPVTVWVNSPISWTNSAPIAGPFLNVTSGGSDVTLTWPAAAQNAGYGAGGYGTGGYGRFEADTSPSYRINVYSANGTVVSSFVANTGYFNYTLAQNSADFNQFGKSVTFKVTPFNGLGDGPVSRSLSLSLTW